MAKRNASLRQSKPPTAPTASTTAASQLTRPVALRRVKPHGHLPQCTRVLYATTRPLTGNYDSQLPNATHLVTGWVRRAHEEVDTPRSENNTNFTINAQEKAATRGGQRGALQFSVSFPYNPPSDTLNSVEVNTPGLRGVKTTATSVLIRLMRNKKKRLEVVRWVALQFPVSLSRES
jgi:hypothetical protein